MSPVRIVTDAGADLPEGLVESLGIRVVRGAVRMNGTDWHGPAEEFWRAVRAGSGTPSTAPPHPDAFADAFAGGDPICAVLVSSELSRTVEHAKQAAGPAGNVHVVDSRSLSVGTGLVAEVLAQAAGVDADLDQVKRLARRLVDQVHLHAVIDDVGYLRRGGRAGLVDADAKPGFRSVVAVKGHVIPLGRAKDRAGAIRQLLDHLDRHAPQGIERWAVGHGDAIDVDEFTAGAAARLGARPDFVVPIGPSVGTHAGPGSLVVGFLAGPGSAAG
jgi:DegV family protein with EDD domain